MSSTDMSLRKYKRAPDCAFREIEGEVFIVSSKTAGVHLLNPTGTFIWSLLDGDRTIKEIARALTDEFDVDLSVAERDIVDFIDEASVLGIIELSD